MRELAKIRDGLRVQGDFVFDLDLHRSIALCAALARGPADVPPMSLVSVFNNRTGAISLTPAGDRETLSLFLPLARPTVSATEDTCNPSQDRKIPTRR